MGTLIKLFISLVITAGICGMLILSGVIELDSKPDKAKTEIRQTAAPETESPPEADKSQNAKDRAPEKESHPAKNEGGHKEALSKSVAAPAGEEPKDDKQKADIKESDAAANAPDTLNNQSKTGAMPDKEQSSGMAAKRAYASIDSEIYERALSYLYFLANDPAGSAERRFSKFLKTEFDLDDKTIDQLLQMTFWKNFLVFQKKWSPGDAKALKQAFDQEMELKKAGFEAKGLKLMTAEINAAKSRLSEFGEQLAQGSISRAASAEEAP